MLAETRRWRNVARAGKWKGKRDRRMVLLQKESGTRVASVTKNEPARRVWPDAVVLREVLQNPARFLCPELDLCYGAVAADRNGFPLTFTGRFAVVFRLTLPGGVCVALRIFTSPDNSFGGDREARSERLMRSLTRLQAEIGDLLPPFVYLPRAVRVGETWYPAQVLPWAEGEPFLSFVTKNRDRAPVLRTLAATLNTAVDRLESMGAAHGDLQHDNIMVSESGERVTFVDYDALYTPDLSDFAPPAERGHPNYQHPQRRAAEYGIGMDRFPLTVIRSGLLLLADAPHLWKQTGGDANEGVLFTASDFAAPGVSPLWGAAKGWASLDAELAESIAALHARCVAAPSATTKSVSPLPNDAAIITPKLRRYPSRVTPTCDEEQTRPVSYLAPLYTLAFQREEAAHIHALRAYLLIAPPVVCIAWLMAWDFGGTKWPFLAYLLVLLSVLQVTYLYLAWGVKRQRDALDLEYGKLMEAERQNSERKKHLSERLARCKAKNLPEPDAWHEREHLRKVLSHIPLSRSIGEIGVSAPVVRELRGRGIGTAAHLWQRHGFLPAGTDAAQASLLRTWLSDLEVRERERFAREYNPVLALEERLARMTRQSEKRAARLAELDEWRASFPDASFATFLRRLLPSHLRFTSSRV